MRAVKSTTALSDREQGPANAAGTCSTSANLARVDRRVQPRLISMAAVSVRHPGRFGKSSNIKELGDSCLTEEFLRSNALILLGQKASASSKLSREKLFTLSG